MIYGKYLGYRHEEAEQFEPIDESLPPHKAQK